MQFLKGDKVFNFLLGLIYGYRTANMDMKIRPISEFKKEEYEDFTLYYLNKEKGEVSKEKPLEECSHIVAVKEDLTEKKVKIVIFKK